MAATQRPLSNPALRRNLLRRLMSRRDHHDRNLARRRQCRHRGAFALQDPQVLRHRAEALGVAPERLHHGMDVRWELPHLADQPFERLRRRGTEDPDEAPRGARSATREQRQAGAHDPEARQEGTDPRELPAAPQQSCALGRHSQPLDRRVDEYEAGHPPGMARRVRAHDKAAERVAHEHATRPTRHLPKQRLQVVDDAGEGPRAGGHVAPGEARAVVGTDARERRYLGLNERPAQG